MEHVEEQAKLPAWVAALENVVLSKRSTQMLNYLYCSNRFLPTDLDGKPPKHILGLVLNLCTHLSWNVC